MKGIETTINWAQRIQEKICYQFISFLPFFQQVKQQKSVDSQKDQNKHAKIFLLKNIDGFISMFCSFSKINNKQTNKL